MINLSAYAEDRGSEPGDECVGRTLHSSKSEGGRVASADSAKEIYVTTGITPFGFTFYIAPKADI